MTRALPLRPVLLLLLLVALLAPGAPARAAWLPEGVDLTRPRVDLRAGDVPAIQARLEREPWRTVAERMWSRIERAEDRDLDDHLIPAERDKTRAARNLAFFYAVDRKVVRGDPAPGFPTGVRVVPFASAAEREAAGDRVRELLVHMFNRSRLALDLGPGIGDWDRDITTSEELLQYAAAWDTLLGAGYDAGADAEVIERNLVDLASELYLHYTQPGSAGDRALDHQNNHRLKSAVALVIAAIAVAEHVPEPGEDPLGIRDPALWLAYGLDQADEMFRWVLFTGDGAYAEGPFYSRFASINWLPFARAWHRLVGDVDWPTSSGVLAPSPWSHPLFQLHQRWMLDMTLPDGSLAPFDDGNPGRSHYFGAVPGSAAERASWLWRWANAPRPYEIDGNIELGVDALVMGDDGIVPAPPAGSATAFYEEGGNAVFRSDWSEDAIYALALAEHDTAALFGRGRDGLGVVPQSHEHMEPGAFLLHAFGERLLMDPGYLSFPERSVVNQPQHHNTILVDGRGPVDFLATSFFFWRNDLAARPPTDGLATLDQTIDTGFLDAARAAFRVGLFGPAPPTDDLTLFRRRFLFPDHRYLVLADSVSAKPGAGHRYTWLFHGNGGGTSGGDYERTASGARWARPAARVDVGLDLDVVAPALSDAQSGHEAPTGELLSHTVLRGEASGDALRAAALVYPTPAGAAPPAIARLGLPGVAGLRLDDADGDRRVALAHRAGADGALALPAAATGLADAASDGTLALFDAHADGTLRLAWAEEATHLTYDGTRRLASTTPGRLGWSRRAGRVEGVAETGSGQVRVGHVGFVPASVEGACAWRVEGDEVVVTLSRERRFALRADGGNSLPGADPGVGVTSTPGAWIQLDGSASCDADGDALSARWELVSAPAGSAWRLEDADGFEPRLLTDRPGPYRVRLVVNDARGGESLPAELLILAGERCSDGRDNDMDGLFDHPEDPGCATPSWPIEDPACSNGGDDDGDLLVDFPSDPECTAPHEMREDVACGLGFELAGLLPALLALRRLRRR